MDLEETKLFSQGLAQSVLVVNPYFEKIHERVGAIIRPTPRDELFIGMILRTCAIVATLKKLDSPSCFQSILSANRTLLELAVDNILLFRDEHKDAARRMIAWESSAKLERAEKIVEYYSSAGRPVPEQFQPSELYIRTDKARIEAERLALGWTRKGKPAHSPRWTSRNLRRDARRADELVRTNLEEVYVTEHAMLCWFVHSGLAGVRIDEQNFYGICGFGAESCCSLALLSASYFLKALRFTDALDVREELEEIERMREQARRNATLRVMELQNRLGKEIPFAPS